MEQTLTASTPPYCSLLVFVATGSELAALKQAARELGLPFRRKKGRLGTYHDLDHVGTERVLAVQTDMGPFASKGSAAKALQYFAETQATSLISIGMAFGVAPGPQQAGHVLISTGLLPYDSRKVTGGPEGEPVIDYSETATFPARASLLALSRRAAEKQRWAGRVHFGLFLSGGARIHCAKYRDQLVATCGKGRGEPVVGGDMEGVGFLATSDRDDPRWIIVKGISDFADESRDEVIEANRPTACYNAAKFVLEALVSQELPHA